MEGGEGRGREEEGGGGLLAINIIIRTHIEIASYVTTLSTYY